MCTIWIIPRCRKHKVVLMKSTQKKKKALLELNRALVTSLFICRQVRIRLIARSSKLKRAVDRYWPTFSFGSDLTALRKIPKTINKRRLLIYRHAGMTK